MSVAAQKSPSRSPSKSPSRPAPTPAAASSNGGGGMGAMAGAAASSPPSSSFLSNQPGLLPAAAGCSYAPCFCEENVWKLCEHLKRNAGPNQLSRTSVVFVSNKKQVVPLWRQKAGKDEEKLVIWDYHVLLILRQPDDRCLVYDLDSDLPFPTYFHKYVTETFRTDAILNPEYHRFFRVVPAPTFLAKFSSDRRHMKKPDGSWMKPPPNYPIIQTSESKHNLDDFISMDASVGVGDVVSLKEFVQMFHRRQS